MYIMRWLVTHPIMMLWILTVLAILFSQKPSTTYPVERPVEQVVSVSQSDVVFEPSKEATVFQEMEPIERQSNALKEKSVSEQPLSINDNGLLRQARSAYWKKDFHQSVALYEELIRHNPSIFHYKGELGNVYWAQNRQREAAQLYAEIAVPMLKAGLIEPVINMLDLIRLHFPEEAGKISAHLHH